MLKKLQPFLARPEFEKKLQTSYTLAGKKNPHGTAAATPRPAKFCALAVNFPDGVKFKLMPSFERILFVSSEHLCTHGINDNVLPGLCRGCSTEGALNPALGLCVACVAYLRSKPLQHCVCVACGAVRVVRRKLKPSSPFGILLQVSSCSFARWGAGYPRGAVPDPIAVEGLPLQTDLGATPPSPDAETEVEEPEEATATPDTDNEADDEASAAAPTSAATIDAIDLIRSPRPAPVPVGTATIPPKRRRGRPHRNSIVMPAEGRRGKKGTTIPTLRSPHHTRAWLKANNAKASQDPIFIDSDSGNDNGGAGSETAPMDTGSSDGGGLDSVFDGSSSSSDSDSAAAATTTITARATFRLKYAVTHTDGTSSPKKRKARSVEFSDADELDDPAMLPSPTKQPKRTEDASTSSDSDSDSVLVTASRGGETVATLRDGVLCSPDGTPLVDPDTVSPPQPPLATIYQHGDQNCFVSMYRESMDRLTGEEWLTDTDILFHGYDLVTNRLNRGSRSSVAFCQPQIISGQRFANGTGTDVALGREIFERDLVLVPIAADNLHFQLLVFYNFAGRIPDAARATVCLINSLGINLSVPGDLEETMAPFILEQAKLYEARTGVDMAWIEKTVFKQCFVNFTRPTEIHTQTCDWACGYYVIEYARILIQALIVYGQRLSSQFGERRAQLAGILSSVGPASISRRVPVIRQEIIRAMATARAAAL